MVRKAIALLAGVVVLGMTNYSIVQRERLLHTGTVVLLELAPVDPRSLMQGDYMALRFAASSAIPHDSLEQAKWRQCTIVLRLDARGVGSFARLDQGQPLAANEVRMRYRLRNGEVKFATNAYFFQEGQADLYRSAGFGEFRVDAQGESILTHLRDRSLQRLGRG